MSKYVSEAGLPHGIHYRIHSHHGLQGREREPHVHIYSQDCDAKYSLRSAELIEGSHGSAAGKQIAGWVREHLTELCQEWARADDPRGGRN